MIATALLAFATLVQSVEHTTLPGLKECTVVPVEMTDDVDSSKARPGDFFRFETVNSVTQGHKILIPARTMGYGIVTIASPAGKEGHSGSLVLEPRYLVLPSGTKLGVVMDHNVSDLDRSGSTGDAPGYLGAIPVPGVSEAVGIFNYFHHGKNILVKRGTIFMIFPSDDPSTELCQNQPQ